MSLLFDKSKTGKNKFSIPKYTLTDADEIPGEYTREKLDLVDVSEVDVVRHYTELSTMNFGVDNGMYPLGSCTMKYNPKINEKIAASESFAALHPLAGEEQAQGALEILYLLGEYLAEITGMYSFTTIPAAGAHGELASVMIIKKYFEKNNSQKDTILIPDSAHGTNPASVTMCGFKVREVPSTEEGDVDVSALKSILDSNQNIAAMMLTSPSTLGLFDKNITQIARLLHDAGALFYCDGANLNAIIGKAKITDLGFDIMHINLHKTFSTPHGGGGPGSGPVGVVEKLAPFLPVPVIEKKSESYSLVIDKPESIGRIHSFYGNFLVALKAFVYITMLGKEGISEISDYAVLNANYLFALLKDTYNVPIDRVCMHEFIINDKDFPNGVTTNDIAKRILDFGFHAPTVYFPLLISGAIMVEPTETETKASLDSFAETMKQIKKEAEENPELVKNAPHNTPVKRIDAVTAARKPVLKWEA